MGNKISEDMPGEGWIEVEPGPSRELRLALIGADGQIERMWAREKPTPPLPTEPYTVIRVTWRWRSGPGPVLTLVGDKWGNYSAGDLSQSITGFEVLAEPRPGAVKRAEESAQRLIVKAVLARVRSYVPDIDRTLDRIAREFEKEMNR